MQMAPSHLKERTSRMSPSAFTIASCETDSAASAFVCSIHSRIIEAQKADLDLSYQSRIALRGNIQSHAN